MVPVPVTNTITSLFDAVYSARLSIVRNYIKAQKNNSKVDWDVPNRNGFTPLMCAAYFNMIAIVRLLLKYSNPGPTIALVGTRYKKTALIIAAQRGFDNIAQQLLDADPSPRHVDLRARNTQASALLAAASKGYWNTVLVILSYKPTIDFLNVDGEGALHFAIKAQQFRAIHQMVTGAGVRTAVNQKNRARDTPLHLAAKTGRVVIITDILDAGGDKNALDAWGFVPATRAGNMGYPQLEFLINGYTPSPYAPSP